MWFCPASGFIRYADYAVTSQRFRVFYVVSPGFISFRRGSLPLRVRLAAPPLFADGLPRRNLGGAEMKTGGGGDSFSPVRKQRNA